MPPPLLCPLKRRSRENGKIPNLSLVLLPDFFLYIVSFFALDLIPKQQASVLSGIMSYKVKEWNCILEEASKNMEFIISKYRLPTGVGGVEEGIGEGWVANLACLRVFIYYGPILSVSFSDWLLLSSLSSNNFKNQLVFPIFLPLSSLEAFCTWRINSFVLWHPVFCKTNISMVLASSNGHFCTSSFPCPYPICPFAFNSSQCPLQSGNPNCCWEQGQWLLKLLPAE